MYILWFKFILQQDPHMCVCCQLVTCHLWVFDQIIWLWVQFVNYVIKITCLNNAISFYVDDLSVIGTIDDLNIIETHEELSNIVKHLK